MHMPLCAYVYMCACECVCILFPTYYSDFYKAVSLTFYVVSLTITF